MHDLSDANDVGPHKPAETPLQKFIEHRLKTLGITATAAERKAGLAKGFIGDIRRGTKKHVRSSNIRELALALDCSPQDLIDLDEGPTQPEPSSSSHARGDGLNRPEFVGGHLV